jgi:omega-6 fatty acid desaturase (delta-12 desaturase)
MGFPDELTATEKSEVGKIAQPIKELPFTLRELKQAIPAKLFEASLVKSWYYIIKDLCQFALCAYLTSVVLSLLPEGGMPWTLLRAAVWILHGFVQGTTGFGLWVIGHECGHQAYFGHRKSLNNAVGFVIHSCMLVPFHSWRITHGTHHRFTNNLQKDTAFPPYRQPAHAVPLYETMPILELFHVLVYLTIGFPVYLTLNFAGQFYPNRVCSHFWPYSPIFRPSERQDVFLSVAGFAAVVMALGGWSYRFGFSHMACWYLLPYLFCNAWLVCVTLLQHSSPQVPHYDNEEWDFLKGALSTVDRDYGIFNSWLHHITNGHVAHHIFSEMAFYNAMEATPYLAKVMGPYYKTDKRPLLTQFKEAFHHHVYSYLVWLRYPVQVAKDKAEGKVW